eukprot:12656072-Alexandrium_andersonii.AAC.1
MTCADVQPGAAASENQLRLGATKDRWSVGKPCKGWSSRPGEFSPPMGGGALCLLTHLPRGEGQELARLSASQ